MEVISPVTERRVHHQLQMEEDVHLTEEEQLVPHVQADDTTEEAPFLFDIECSHESLLCSIDGIPGPSALALTSSKDDPKGKHN